MTEASKKWYVTTKGQLWLPTIRAKGKDVDVCFKDHVLNTDNDAINTWIEKHIKDGNKLQILTREEYLEQTSPESAYIEHDNIKLHLKEVHRLLDVALKTEEIKEITLIEPEESKESKIIVGTRGGASALRKTK